MYNINAPTINEGVFNIESRNRWDDDDRASKDDFEAHSIKMDYGITPYATIEMQSLWQDGGSGDEYVSTEFETKLRWYRPGEYWLDAAVKFGYEFRHDDRADQIKTKLLLQKNVDKLNNVANLNLSKEVGGKAEKDAEMSISWRSKYTITPAFEPGFEYYGGFGELADMPGYSEQSHNLGPMFFGELLPGVKYQAGYLFGISHAAPDGSAKFFLRYEIPL